MLASQQVARLDLQVAVDQLWREVTWRGFQHHRPLCFEPLYELRAPAEQFGARRSCVEFCAAAARLLHESVESFVAEQQDQWQVFGEEPTCATQQRICHPFVEHLR